MISPRPSDARPWTRRGRGTCSGKQQGDSTVNDDLSHARWFKSSYSETSGQCVEVAFLPNGTTAIRDSKNPTGPSLTFTSAAWHSFTAAVRVGRL
ncbi:DUF397 domain-containing protein [Nocardia sp. CDC153]|uniref:DUF397 domain-containing protein n=1 Tax=Nocardia sp. CDC153 TaxID=3112167 RepID=UPI002DC015A3|nr:DUF397 domain-containing protein [Nocardia sp. CDC153]MEC3953201.1 DUF397 domain-containing protein [Nocardia sp. CDC153]